MNVAIGPARAAAVFRNTCIYCGAGTAERLPRVLEDHLLHGRLLAAMPDSQIQVMWRTSSTPLDHRPLGDSIEAPRRTVSVSVGDLPQTRHGARRRSEVRQLFARDRRLGQDAPLVFIESEPPDSYVLIVMLGIWYARFPVAPIRV